MTASRDESAVFHLPPRKLFEIVESLELDLQGRTVLTEAATGPYVVTPLLAALSGATVYAYAQSTRYGTSQEAIDLLDEHLRVPELSPYAHQVHAVSDLTPEILAAADVVTNSGHLRPLDRELLQHVHQGAVVPLMFEAWEWRGEDIDRDYLRGRGIRLVATNERHPRIDVFGYLGEMAAKLIHDAGCAVYRNRFTIISNTPFGPFIARTLVGMGAAVAVLDEEVNRQRYGGIDAEWIGTFPSLENVGDFRSSEAVIVALYPFERSWIASEGVITPAALAAAFDDAVLLRYAGHANDHDLDASGVRHYPELVPAGHMGILPSALGFDPIIRLQAGGLRAAQASLTGDFQLDGVAVAVEM